MFGRSNDEKHFDRFIFQLRKSERRKTSSRRRSRKSNKHRWKPRFLNWSSSGGQNQSNVRWISFSFCSNRFCSRSFRLLFVFDREASSDLRGKQENALLFANQLAKLASQYMAHANIRVVAAAVELWSNNDKISFPTQGQPHQLMPIILESFQKYLKAEHGNKFGQEFSVGVLISNKNSVVAGGFAQGPPCSTSGALVMHYRPIPWSIAGLLAHELAHTLSVVHPMEVSFICDDHRSLPFCKSGQVPEECLCASASSPHEQCLMTFAFGRAKTNAARFTSCDIEMMNFFSGNHKCLNPVRNFDWKCFLSGKGRFFRFVFSDQFSVLQTVKIESNKKSSDEEKLIPTCRLFDFEGNFSPDSTQRKCSSLWKRKISISLRSTRTNRSGTTRLSCSSTSSEIRSKVYRVSTEIGPNLFGNQKLSKLWKKNIEKKFVERTNSEIKLSKTPNEFRSLNFYPQRRWSSFEPKTLLLSVVE